jgi:ankyrin repeat protein
MLSYREGDNATNVLNLFLEILSDEEVGDIMSVRDHRGDTPLHLMCEANSYWSVYYITHRKNINTGICNNNRETPWHIAAKLSDETAITLLGSCSINCVNMKDNNDNTPLHIACLNQQVKIINYLLYFEPNINIRNKGRKTVVDIYPAITEMIHRVNEIKRHHRI